MKLAMMKAAAISAALLTSTSAFAQWQGTWSTPYGQLKLVQTGSFVYGDYGTNGSHISGTLSSDKRTLRARFWNTNPGKYGFVEFNLDYSNRQKARGRWVWSAGNRMPRTSPSVSDRRGGLWEAQRISGTKPSLSQVIPLRIETLPTFVQAFTRQERERFWFSWQTDAGYARQRRTLKHPWQNKVPATSKWALKYLPDTVGISFSKISLGNEEGGNWELYGKAGVYAYCGNETQAASRTFFDFGRRDAKGSTYLDRSTNPWANFGGGSGSLKACLARSNDLKLQIQTNFTEKDGVRARADDAFGYRAFVVKLSELPTTTSWKSISPQVQLRATNKTHVWDVKITSPRGGGNPEVLTMDGQINLGFGGCNKQYDWALWEGC